MPTKQRRKIIQSKSIDWDCRLEDVLVSQVTTRTFVLYQLSNGPFEDIATAVERRCAVFASTGWSKDLRAEILSVKDKTYYYEGLPGAVIDYEIEDTQVADEAAEQAKHEYELLTDSERSSGWYNRHLAEDQDKYGSFLDAIDRLAEDDEDENAWAAIEAWRSRLAMQHES